MELFPCKCTCLIRLAVSQVDLWPSLEKRLTRSDCLQVETELSKIDAYFTKLAKGMRAWIEAWDMINGTGKAANGRE